MKDRVIEQFRQIQLERRLGLGHHANRAGQSNSTLLRRSSAVVRRPNVWKFGEQVVMGSRVVRLYFAIREERDEVLDDAVREQPAIRRVDRRARRVVWEN